LTTRARQNVGLRRTLAQVNDHAADLLRERRYLEASAESWRELAARAPYGMQDHLRLADVLWELGDREAAAAEYQQVLKINDWSYLDPLRQLPAEKLETVKARAMAFGPR
jgi:hypothetical protein